MHDTFILATSYRTHGVGVLSTRSVAFSSAMP